ncbi:UDP-N-acetylmuramate dehydrogenase [Xanthovirga aplysinae]|uniref:UDP-N-acetylmuramate dehydrogenase n=1 Tax=Xanthovirga aplysinae TaxID=2529853 RepID=UPI0012BC6791|nr:UDP-N-acetylmuramate dehydrogenase [Xanthovirga aplysinae]MTI30328.1 UDP-N-acetylmuramate dehydrogenase [Xanthovirga aplysinae]
MEILRNTSLKPFNTFGIDVKAKFFCSVTSIQELKDALNNPLFIDLPKLILGGGSNVLFTKPFEGLVIKLELKGKEVIKEDENHAWIKVGAGENWHNFVLHTISSGYSGLENLSLIPGTVGAAPLQNIGAYGVEVKESIEHLEAFNIKEQQIQVFQNQECQFGYRHSIFKNELRGQFIILNVTFKLNKKPDFKISYGAIKETLNEMKIDTLSPKVVSEAVIKIRQSKLPDPNQIGNAGSFFKNPYISIHELKILQKNYPNIPFYPQSNETVKIPAGWLIEKSGWKGKNLGNAGVHEKQALVLVNRGNAQGNEIKMLAEEIQSSVEEKFGIKIHPEVNIL